MQTLMLEGGWPMWFTLLFGGLSLVTAVWYAAGRGRLGVVVALGTATAFTSLMGMCADLAAVGHHLNQRWDETEEPARMAFQGFAESMSPGILGFTFVALTAFVVAVAIGRRGQSAGVAVAG